MKGLPFVNQQLQVEAVGFHSCNEGQLGVLITPWFMNLILLPVAAKDGTCLAGDKSDFPFPSGTIEFTCCEDEQLGQYLSAVLFRTVSDFPNQAVARDIARHVLKNINVTKDKTRTLSRRAVLTGCGPV